LIVLKVGYHAKNRNPLGKVPDPLFFFHMFFYPVVPVEVPSVRVDFYGRGYDFFRCNNIFVLLKFFIRVIFDSSVIFSLWILELNFKVKS